MKLTPLISVLFAASLVSPAAAAYVNTQYKFSASAPSGWKQINYPGVLVAFAAPVAKAGFANNINVIAQAVPAGMSLQQFQEASQTGLKQLITDYRALGSRATSLGGNPARELAFSGRQGKYPLYFIQTFSVTQGRAYIVTSTSLLSEQASLATPNSAFVRSFKFSK